MYCLVSLRWQRGAVLGVGLRPLGCCDCRFTLRQSHVQVCLSPVSAVCCQVEVSASSLSLVQEGPTECGASNECDRQASPGKAISRSRVEAPRGGGGVFRLPRSFLKILHTFAKRKNKFKGIMNPNQNYPT